LAGGSKPLPEEFNQKVILEVSDEYKLFQAARSSYDIGDLQSFHVQHTFPIVVGGMFEEIFREVEIRSTKPEMAFETQPPDVPAIFEVLLLDMTHDNLHDTALYYESEISVALALKSPRGNVFWQKGFVGYGKADADLEHNTGYGPQKAINYAVEDMLYQMKEAIINSPEVRVQLRHYREADLARRRGEVQV